jgi:hypothetical protein
MTFKHKTTCVVQISEFISIIRRISALCRATMAKLYVAIAGEVEAIVNGEALRGV